MFSRRSFLQGSAVSAATLFAASASAKPQESGLDGNAGTDAQTTVQLIRSATLKVSLGGTTFLVDPMLSPKASWPGFAYTINSEAKNPLTDLPMPLSEVLSGVDAVLLTHLHEDHWDEAARKAIPKEMPIFTDSEAHRKAVMKEGFRSVKVLEPGTMFNGVKLSPMLSQHGTDEVMASHPTGDSLGTTMGILLEHRGAASVYVVGDSIWKPFTTMQLGMHRPDIVVLNTGNALITESAHSIIMGTEDFMRAYREAPWASIVAVHMDAVNHCVLRRRDLRDVIALRGLDPKRAFVPDDGELLRF